jgi:subtilisin family serine protease
MKRHSIVLGGVLLLASAGSAFADDQNVIVGFKTGTDATLVEKHGGTVDGSIDGVKALACHVPASAISSLRSDENVAYVEEDGIAEISGKPAPAQPAESTPWGITRVGAPVSGNTGAGIKVAVVDTGIDLDHPDLAANLGTGVNYVATTKPPEDDNGHGSHVAGTIGAVDNSIGVVGVAPGASLYAVKVLDRRGYGYWSAIAQGVTWAASNGMNIANLSLGGGYTQVMDDACANAEAAGLLIVVAAGNSGDGNVSTTELEYPAGFSTVVAVGATNSSDGLASFSSTGSHVDVSGPGVGVLSCYKGDTYKTLNGTSMATPHAAGVAALLWGVVSSPTNDSVRAELEARAVDLGSSGFDNGFGNGLVHY